jgi:hypothetical protein
LRNISSESKVVSAAAWSVSACQDTVSRHAREVLVGRSFSEVIKGRENDERFDQQENDQRDSTLV